MTAGSWQSNGTAGAGGSTPAFTVDTVTPTVAVAINSTDVNLAHNTATVTFTFSEAPTSFGLSDVTYSGGTLGSLTQVNPTTYTALFTAAANTDISTAQVSVTANSWSEVNSNPGSGGSTPSFTVDTVTPTVAVAINSTDVNLAHNTATVTFTFSEAPTSFGLSDVTYSGGTLGSLTQVNPTTYTALFTAAANTDISTAQVSVTANSWSEVNSNPGSGGSTPSFTVDTVTPTVAVSTNNTDVTVANPTGTVTFAFSEAPVTFVLADTSAVGGTLSNLQKTDATHYTATFTGAANTNISTASVSATAGSWQEGNGNAGRRQHRRLHRQHGDGDADGGGVDQQYRCECCQRHRDGDIRVQRGPGHFCPSGHQRGRRHAEQPAEDRRHPLHRELHGLRQHRHRECVGERDRRLLAEQRHCRGGGSTPAFTVDTVTPTAAVAINSTDVNLAHNTATVTFTFSEAPTSFGLSDVTYSGGTLGSLTQVNPTTYTALFTAAANTDISTAQVSVTANSWSEVNSNPGSGGSTPSFTVDTVTPTVAVATNNTDVNVANNTGTVTFTFSEAPTSFGLSDVTYSGGTLGSLTQVNPTTYTATLFTAAANTDISTAQVSVTANSWSEVNSNPGSGGSTPSFTVDTVTPTVAVAINSTDVNLAHNTATVTFTFSEAPTSFGRLQRRDL